MRVGSGARSLPEYHEEDGRDAPPRVPTFPAQVGAKAWMPPRYVVEKSTKPDQMGQTVRVSE